MAKKQKQKEKAPNAAPSVENAERPTPIPTYPLSPSEIEVILHIRWDGSSFGPSERAGKKAITLSGDELIKHAIALPFDPARRDIAERTVEYAIQGSDDFLAMLPRAHRVQLVTTNKKLPEELSGTDWNAGKTGVAKDDGFGILLTRPIA